MNCGLPEHCTTCPERFPFVEMCPVSFTIFVANHMVEHPPNFFTLMVFKADQSSPTEHLRCIDRDDIRHVPIRSPTSKDYPISQYLPKASKEIASRTTAKQFPQLSIIKMGKWDEWMDGPRKIVKMHTHTHTQSNAGFRRFVTLTSPAESQRSSASEWDDLGRLHAVNPPERSHKNRKQGFTVEAQTPLPSLILPIHNGSERTTRPSVASDPVVLA